MEYSEEQKIRTGALFPGQGSQFVGMGQFLYKEFPSVRHCFEEACDSLEDNITRLCFEGPEDQLNLTKNTQPALLTLSIATLRLIQELTGIRLYGASGHSVGEYGALVSAGVIPFSTALKTGSAERSAYAVSRPSGAGSHACRYRSWPGGGGRTLSMGQGRDRTQFP